MLEFCAFVFNTEKIGKQRGNSYQKMKRSLEKGTHMKFNWNILTVTDVFFDQKRVCVCEHTVNTEPHESFGIMSPGGLRDRKERGVQGMKGKLNGLCLEYRTNRWTNSRWRQEIWLVLTGIRLWSTYTLRSEGVSCGDCRRNSFIHSF